MVEDQVMANQAGRQVLEEAVNRSDNLSLQPISQDLLNFMHLSNCALPVFDFYLFPFFSTLQGRLNCPQALSFV